MGSDRAGDGRAGGGKTASRHGNATGGHGGQEALAMPGHADILDRPEPLLQSFWGSVLLHGLAIGGLLGAGVVERASRLQMGDPHGGGLGGVMVNPVATIPLPNRGGLEN